MKVLILCANYEPGGAQRAAIRLYKELDSRGLTCMCSFLHRKSVDFTVPTPNVILNKKISSPFDVLTICIRLYKQLKREKPDAVISFLPYANIIGQFIALISGIKIRVSSHRNLSEKELGSVLKTIDLLWARLGVYTAITAVSKSTKKSFRYYGLNVYQKIHVINNGISFSPSGMSKTACRQKLGIPESAFIIGNVGRMVEQKNHQLLINIMPMLGDTVLVIVGKGELRPQLEERAATLGVLNRVVIIEELSTDAIPHFLKAIDVFVMPSHFEGMSNALAEALYAGLPIVSSDVESQSDVLIRDSDGLESGILVSNNDPEGWAKQILAIRNNEALRSGLSEKALIRSRDFTIEYMADGFIQTLR